jgi:hypothetical protein
MGSTVLSLRCAKTQTTLQAVDGRFGGEIDAQIGESGHELLGRQMRVPRTPQHRDDLGLFGGGERIARATMRSAPTIVTAGAIAPALNGTSGDADDPAGLGEARTGGLRLSDGGED